MFITTVNVDNREIFLKILKAKAKSLGYNFDEIKHDRNMLKCLHEDVMSDFEAAKKK